MMKFLIVFYLIFLSDSSISVSSNSASIASGKVDVSALSPSGAPGILDDPNSVVSETNSKDSMIDVFIAVSKHSR